MIDDQKIEQAFNDFDTALKSKGATAGQALPANFDPCGTWKSIKGTVDAIITGLKAIGNLFPIAKKAADVLATLRDILNAVCP